MLFPCEKEPGFKNNTENFSIYTIQSCMIRHQHIALVKVLIIVELMFSISSSTDHKNTGKRRCGIPRDVLSLTIRWQKAISLAPDSVVMDKVLIKVKLAISTVMLVN